MKIEQKTIEQLLGIYIAHVDEIRPDDCPTKFRAEMWTSGAWGEQWAVIMIDGDEPNSPCAFGAKETMVAYAHRLNLCKGILNNP